jgi:membrane-bound lytic murein transglycosylase D
VLPRETANYVPAILAMTIVAKNAREYGVEEIDPEPPLEYETVELEAPTHLALVAEALDRPVSELKDLNPSLLRSVAPAGYSLHIPRETRNLVEEAFQAIPASHRDSWRIHRMETGDTFASIAKKYSTSSVLVSSTNRDELPEVGRLAAVPAPYPGDRPVVTRQAVQRVAVPTRQSARTTPVKAPARKPQAQVHAPVSRAVAVKHPLASAKPTLRAAAHRPGA